MVTSIANEILSLHGPLVYGLVAALAFGEAAVLLGFVLPGETAVILGGVIASQGNVNIVVMIVVATVAAIAGDSVGYEVGRLLGPRLLAVRPLRRRHAGVEKARDFIRRWGAWAVVLGRLTAFLRAVVPGLAGMGGMHYPRFLMANALGGVLWATGFTLLGYFLGSTYKRVLSVSSWAAAGFVAVVVVVLVGLRIRARVRERRTETETGSEDELLD
ncbi:MAG: DedA family protein [Actinobacteria bacterium]|nr:MAG: DedA family protein [Actinomycetota bacterium]